MASLCKIEHAIGETRAAIIHKKQTIEYHVRRWSEKNKPHAGDVFSGRVRAVDKGLMAAFIDLGSEPAGMLRFSMSPNAPHMHEGQMIRVKVLRDGEPGKGPLLGFVELSDVSEPCKEIAQSLEDEILARYPKIVFEQGDVNGISWACEEEVALKTGGYIYIEPTRAATMIDVDTAGGQKSKVSIAAAREIAHQVRLRGIGGLVLIDFPNFRKKKDKADVWQTLKDCFEGDPNTVKIAPFSRFDTVELTRSRSGPTIAQILHGPTGQGQSRELSAETLALQGLRRLVKEARIDGGAKLVLELPVTAYEWLNAEHIDWKTSLGDKIGQRFTLKSGAKIDVYKDAP
ncbi:MAG: hypothetical protein COA69_04565 [Robiginitomaculum sp.]|nr:MAG: hypothetical protein COA69_04565 [Robiginitomaculum sp.]